MAFIIFAQFSKKEALCLLGSSVLHTDKSFQITKQEQIAGSQLISLMVQSDYQRTYQMSCTEFP